MKLTIGKEALLKIKQLTGPDDILLIDLDDGIGEFSKLLMENGLKYQLLIVDKKTLPKEFDHTLTSNAGTVYFNKDTEWYLDPEMHIDFKANTNSFRLWSTNELLEPQMPIKRAIPETTVTMEV